MAAKIKTRIIYRDAETGRIVTEEYARNNPKTTVRETIKVDDKKGK